MQLLSLHVTTTDMFFFETLALLLWQLTCSFLRRCMWQQLTCSFLRRLRFYMWQQLTCSFLRRLRFYSVVGSFYNNRFQLCQNNSIYENRNTGWFAYPRFLGSEERLYHCMTFVFDNIRLLSLARTVTKTDLHTQITCTPCVGCRGVPDRGSEGVGRETLKHAVLCRPLCHTGCWVTKNFSTIFRREIIDQWIS